jgi:hypothetical protein
MPLKSLLKKENKKQKWLWSSFLPISFFPTFSLHPFLRFYYHSKHTGQMQALFWVLLDFCKYRTKTFLNLQIFLHR